MAKFYSSSVSSPGIYSKLTSNMTGLLGATRGLPGAETRPFGNANCQNRNMKNLSIRTWARLDLSSDESNYHNVCCLTGVIVVEIRPTQMQMVHFESN